jgi:microcystin-dependent protein
MARNYRSIAEPKTLNGNVTNITTQITLNNITGLPSPPYVLVLNPDTANEEAVLVTVDQDGVTAPTLKVQRAIETGSTAKAHTDKDVVRHMIVGSDLQLVHNHLDNTDTAHGATGAVVGTTNTQTLTNKTLTTPKINENVNLTATSTELNVLDGITASTSELNIMDGVTSTAAELNILDGATLTTTELNYVDGVTSPIQTQIGTLVNNTPVGAVTMWVTGTAPTGWELCQGQELPITGTYSVLAGVLGTTYGNLTNGSGGVGTTHFRLPDLRGRVPMGAGLGRNVADNADLATSRTLGQRVSDDQTVVLTEAQLASHNHTQNSHGHSINDSGHTHAQKVTAATGGGTGVRTDYTGDYSGAQQYPQGITTDTSGTGISINGNTATNNPTGGNQAHNNTQPSTVINFIIKF